MKQHLLLSFLLSLSLLSLGQNVPSYVPTNGLVGWWPFNGNANDESGNGYHLQVYGVANTSDRFGNNQSALSFTNTQYSVSNYLSANNITPFTLNQYSIQLWVNNRYFYQPGNLTFAYEQLIAFGPQWWNQGPAYGILITDSSKQTAGAEHWTSAEGFKGVGSSFSNNLWNHLVSTYDGFFLRYYLNGVLKDSIATGISYQGQIQVIFGGRPDGPFPGGLYGGFNGEMDDIAIYNRPLSQQEITNLYNASLPPVCPSLPSNLQTGLVGYWPFCGNANDESGNGNHGTVNGATLTVDRFGDSGRAYSFDGASNNIIIPDNDLLELTADFTISAYLNPTSFPSNPFGGKINMVLAKRPNNVFDITGTYSFGIWDVTNNGSHRISFQAPPNANSLTNADTNGIISLNNWYNFVATYQKATQNIKYYLNGIEVFSKILQFDINNTSYPVTIGNCCNSYYWNGKIDDIAIWNRALSPSEITQLYKTQSSNLSEGNVGVNVAAPQRSLHIKDVIRLEPRSSAPENPVSGDMYFDGILKKLRVYDGTTWQNCW